MEQRAKTKHVTFSERSVTGNMAVDMIASCVTYYHSRKKQLSTIYLKRRLYDQWMEYVERKKKAQFKSNTDYSFCGVMIERASIFSIKEMYWEFEQPEVKPKELNG